MSSYTLDERAWARGRNVIAFLGLLGLVGCAAGYAMERQQFLFSWLTALSFWLTAALGALIFVAVMFLTGSAYSVTVRRFAEHMMTTIPAAALLFLPLAFGLHDLYEWTHKEVVANDPILKGKAGYLNEEFFLIRAFAYFAIWSLLGWAIARNSARQDTDPTPEPMHRASRWSAATVLLSMVTVSLASFDWIMSLYPHWYSTIFGIYVYSGGAVAFFAVLILICLGFRASGLLKREINVEHYHDLGKWLFAMTAFWAYIAFSQYMLIWYANLPEETIFFKHRMEGTWKYWSLALPLVHFLVPLFVLISRPAKRNLKLLGFMAGWMLVAHYMDLYWLVMPTLHKEGVVIHWLDFATLAASGSVLAFAFWLRLRRHKLIPVGDLRLQQALSHHN